MLITNPNPTEDLVNVKTQLLHNVLQYVRNSEEIIEEEYGAGQDWSKLEAIGEMPAVYYQLKSLKVFYRFMV